MHISRDVKFLNLVGKWPLKTHNLFGVPSNWHVTTSLIRSKGSYELSLRNRSVKEESTWYVF